MQSTPIYFTCIGKGHGAPAIPATKEQWLTLRNEPWLLAMCQRIEHGDEQLKHRLPIWTPSCAEFRTHHRAVRDALKVMPRLMLDFDQKGHSQEILQRAMQLHRQGRWEVLLVEESVRHGTHVLITLPQGMTAQEAQERFSADVGFMADPALKDVARCIYMVPQQHTLFVNDLLFLPEAASASDKINSASASDKINSASAQGKRTSDEQDETRKGATSQVELPYSDVQGQAEGQSHRTPHAASNQASEQASEQGQAHDPAQAPHAASEQASEQSPAHDPHAASEQASEQGEWPSAYTLTTPDGSRVDIPYTQDGEQKQGKMTSVSIVAVLEEQMGGIPTHGSRNNFIFSMACHLRYVCNDDPMWIAHILPSYGEARDKWMATIRSACNRHQTPHMPRIMQRTLEVCTERLLLLKQDNTPEIPPRMPRKLPRLISLLISKTPDIYKPAVAHAVFPALGAHLWKTRFRYIDNVEHEATLMNVLMAGTGAGKNCISEPINRIMRDIRLRDMENLRREREWKKEMQSKGANKDKRQRPQGLIIQEIDPDMTNAAFVQRLADAEERFLYTRMNEIDQFDALKGSSKGKAQFQIMCLAFDPDNIYGQTRIGTTSVSERVSIRFNWNASTTIQKGTRYFSQVLTDGPISRINFCTIPEREIGAEMPIYGTYDEAFDEKLRPYIENLSNARGLVECPRAVALAKRLIEECADFARLSQSRVYENLSYRANVIAYLKAMVLYVANGEKWDKTMEDFIRWSLQYDLWCKMHFFGRAIDMAESIANVGNQRGPQNLLDLLPDVFTREDAAQLRQKMNMKRGNLKDMLGAWKKRGYIELHGEEMPRHKNDQQKYAKTKEYLMKHISFSEGAKTHRNVDS